MSANRRGRPSPAHPDATGPLDAAHDPVVEAERLFAAAAKLAAHRLTALADQRDLTTITEARHLQPTYRSALDELAARAPSGPVVSRRLAHGLKNEWPRLGNFDISLAWGDVDVFGELKCGETELTLSACGWDAAKQVFCLNHGVGAGMLLVAAAPVALWDSAGVGLELLNDGHWDMADLRTRYAKGFGTWERDGYKPNYVYRHLRTSAVSRTEPFRIGVRAWRLGVARVEPVDEERMDWV
jgi:hypothetical protein